MAKIDYSEVESLLVKGMRKWTAERLRTMTHSHLRKTEAPAKHGKRSMPERLNFLLQLKHEIDTIYLRNKHIYRTLGFPARHLKFAIASYKALPEQHWEKVEQLRDKLDAHTKENPFLNEEGLPETAEESIIETQRSKHSNMRHNVRSDWLPS